MRALICLCWAAGNTPPPWRQVAVTYVDDTTGEADPSAPVPNPVPYRFDVNKPVAQHIVDIIALVRAPHNPAQASLKVCRRRRVAPVGWNGGDGSGSPYWPGKRFTSSFFCFVWVD